MAQAVVEFLEPHIRPEYLEKLNRIKKQPGTMFKTVEDLREHIEPQRTVPNLGTVET